MPSLLPPQFLPWKEAVTGDAAADRKLVVEQVVQLRRALDVLAEEGADGLRTGFVGHDYGAMLARC